MNQVAAHLQGVQVSTRSYPSETIYCKGHPVCYFVDANGDPAPVGARPPKLWFVDCGVIDATLKTLDFKMDWPIFFKLLSDKFGKNNIVAK